MPLLTTKLITTYTCLFTAGIAAATSITIHRKYSFYFCYKNSPVCFFWIVVHFEIHILELCY